MIDLLRSLFEQATEPYRKYATFAGRARRREYFLFVGFQWLVIGLITGLGSLFVPDGGPVMLRTEEFAGGSLAAQITTVAVLLFVIANVVPWLAVSTRRLHDRSYRGWIMARWFLPYVGLLFMLWDLLRKGDKGENAFGPDPNGVNFDDWFE